jgi:hypothetical protein
VPEQIEFAGRGRSRLQRARIDGYLNATGRSRDALLGAHGFWCWRLRVPLIWHERNSAHSRYGSLHVDLSTTANTFTHHGMSELAGVADRLGVCGPVVLTAFEARWDKIPVQRLDELARIIFRVAMRLGNYELKRRTPPQAIVKMMESIRSVQPIRISA